MNKQQIKALVKIKYAIRNYLNETRKIPIAPKLRRMRAAADSSKPIHDQTGNCIICGATVPVCWCYCDECSALLKFVNAELINTDWDRSAETVRQIKGTYVANMFLLCRSLYRIPVTPLI